MITFWDAKNQLLTDFFLLQYTISKSPIHNTLRKISIYFFFVNYARRVCVNTCHENRTDNSFGRHICFGCLYFLLLFSSFLPFFRLSFPSVLFRLSSHILPPTLLPSTSFLPFHISSSISLLFLFSFFSVSSPAFCLAFLILYR